MAVLGPRGCTAAGGAQASGAVASRRGWRAPQVSDVPWCAGSAPTRRGRRRSWDSRLRGREGGVQGAVPFIERHFQGIERRSRGLGRRDGRIGRHPPRAREAGCRDVGRRKGWEIWGRRGGERRHVAVRKEAGSLCTTVSGRWDEELPSVGEDEGAGPPRSGSRPDERGSPSSLCSGISAARDPLDHRGRVQMG